ncbi:hypothetical protein [Sporolituus thermophilus]|uniref:hypothetical protein n=1 Tax=Sporolituus thermophilus TaxID=608505 RepID=UPI001495B6CF|nr:hypothetical protein [Sporolituus thermophilus]
MTQKTPGKYQVKILPTAQKDQYTLASLRKSKKLSQPELARLLKISNNHKLAITVILWYNKIKNEEGSYEEPQRDQNRRKSFKGICRGVAGPQPLYLLCLGGR